MWYNYILYSPNTPKIYIGKTDNLDLRFNQHKIDATNNKYKQKFYLYNSMRKHGIDTFSIEKIEEYETEQEALDGEIFWIAYYKSMGAKLLNMTKGGEGLSGFRHSDESKLILCPKKLKSSFRINPKELILS